MYAALQAGQITTSVAEQLVAAVINFANAAATTLADAYVSAQIETAAGIVTPTTGITPVDDTDRLVKAAQTILGDLHHKTEQQVVESALPADPAREAGLRFERLAHSEPLEVAQHVSVEVMRSAVGGGLDPADGRRPLPTLQVVVARRPHLAQGTPLPKPQRLQLPAESRSRRTHPINHVHPTVRKEPSIMTEPIEEPVTADLPEPEDVQPEVTPDEEPDVFPRSYVEELRQENGRYRQRAQQGETYAQRLHTELVRATGKLADPADVPFDETHLDDPENLTAAIDELLQRKPHLASRRPTDDIGQGASDAASAVDLAALLRQRAQ